MRRRWFHGPAWFYDRPVAGALALGALSVPLYVALATVFPFGPDVSVSGAILTAVVIGLAHYIAVVTGRYPHR